MLGDRPALVVQRDEEQRGDQPFLVPEVVVDRADALAAGLAQVVDRRCLDAVGVEQRQCVAQHVASAGLAHVRERALEQPVGGCRLLSRQILACHVCTLDEKYSRILF